MPTLNELTPDEKKRAKKAITDFVWNLRRRWNLETGAMPIRQKLKKKKEAEFHPHYVAWLEENFAVMDTIIAMSGIGKAKIQEIIKQAGFLHAKAPN